MLHGADIRERSERAHLLETVLQSGINQGRELRPQGEQDPLCLTVSQTPETQGRTQETHRKRIQMDDATGAAVSATRRR